jgi:hypothetical protein
MSVRISIGKKRLEQAGSAIDEMLSLRGLRLGVRGSSRQTMGWRPRLHMRWCGRAMPVVQSVR